MDDNQNNMSVDDSSFISVAAPKKNENYLSEIPHI